MTRPVALESYLRRFGSSELLTAEIASLYLDQPHPFEYDLMRLLNPEEAIRDTQGVRDSWVGLGNDAIVLWTDDNSNYAGVYVNGDLAPRVFLLDHDEPELTPRFFSPASFARAQAAAAKDEKGWHHLRFDYPLLVEAVYQSKDADTQLGLKCLLQYEENPAVGRQAAFNALALLPPERTDVARRLLTATDMYVQERACEVLGARNDKASVPDLCHVALHGKHNGRIGALRALRGMTGREAEDALARLRKELGSEYSPYFR
jgi:hypothetical protein